MRFRPCIDIHNGSVKQIVGGSITDKDNKTTDLTKEELTQFHYLKGDAEGIVNMPLCIKGQKLSISLREDTEKPLVWVSLRSVDDFPANKMAEDFFNMPDSSLRKAEERAVSELSTASVTITLQIQAQTRILLTDISARLSSSRILLSKNN